MQAVAIDAYGGTDQLELREMEVPEPGRGQLRIRVRAAAVNPIDWKLRSGQLRFLLPQRFPLVLGFDAAGEVDALGPGAEGFTVGDPVYARLDTNGGGSYAQYAVAGARAFARKPESLTMEQAAAIPLAALTALQALRDLGGLGEGQKALVNGASGGVGTFAVQIASALGAEATGVCSAANAELVRELGATEVVDYAREDFTKRAASYAVVFDAVANRSFIEARRVLAPGGAYVTTLPSPGILLWAALTAAAPLIGGRKARMIRVAPRGKDLEYLTGLVDDGRLKPLIDSEFPLERIAEAHQRSESGRARGKIVISIP